MRFARSILAFLIASVAFTQSRLEFEVASIKPVADQAPAQTGVGLHMDGSQMRGTYFSLRDYIGIAYRVKVQQILGPEWIATQRFDISAKLPDGATQAQIPEMLQSLLADRFALKLHRDTKEFPVYGLEVARSGLKLKELEVDSNAAETDKGAVNIAANGSAGGVSVNLGKGSYYNFSDNRFEGKKLTMANLAETLSRFMDRPVVDMTGLKKNYDLVLDLSPEDYRAMLIRAAITAGVVLPPQALRALDDAPGDSIPNALQKLGLTILPRKAPLDVIVVDSIQKMPNP